MLLALTEFGKLAVTHFLPPLHLRTVARNSCGLVEHKFYYRNIEVFKAEDLPRKPKSVLLIPLPRHSQCLYPFTGTRTICNYTRAIMDAEKTYAAVSEHYSSVSTNTTQLGEGYTKAVAQSFGYTEEELAAIPAESNLGVSCGNPIATANLKEVRHVSPSSWITG